jgi:ribosome-interacting GTPase 1
MPANLTPDYLAAEQRYREAKTPKEELAALEEMLSTIPKHKGTSKLQADLKRKISHAKQALQAPKKGGATGHDPFAIQRQGAGQVILIGTPNTGKSSIVGALTKAAVKIADWPFSTPVPVPGMCHFEDVPIQLIDTPPLTAEQAPPGLAGAVYGADIVAIVLEASAGSILDDAEACLNFVKARRLKPTSDPHPKMPEDPEEPKPKRCLILANKCDLPDSADSVQMLQEFFGQTVRIVPCSAATGEGVKDLPKTLFDLLYVMRVYAKPPGKPPDMEAPFILKIGSTVLDMAGVVHRDLPAKLKSARVWGTGVHDGQQVQRDHVLYDRDVVELQG